MSQSSREYVATLFEFFSICLSKGAVSIKKFEPDLLTIYPPGVSFYNPNNAPSFTTFQKPMSLRVKMIKSNTDNKSGLTIKKKKNKKPHAQHWWNRLFSRRVGYRAWVFPFTAKSNIIKLRDIMDNWDDYLVGLKTNGKCCHVWLTDHNGKCAKHYRIPMYTIKT